MDKVINYSIIIPHKNTPELLQRCIDSIPRREDVQIIVIDDNSDSDKVDFEHFPGLNDPFVEVVFTKEGKGAGYARNVGLTKAIGKWLLFSDADDYFTDNFLQYLDKYGDSNYDLIYFGMYGIDAKTKQKHRFDRIYHKRMYEAIYNKNYNANKYTSYSPCAKIMKRFLIKENNIAFDETMVSNDRMFSVKTAYYAKDVFFDEYEIYYRVVRSGSLIFLKTLEATFDRLCVSVRVNAFLESIDQAKYKTDIIKLLLRLIDIRNMSYFYKSMALIKENKINLFPEFVRFCLSLPHLIIRKIKNLMLDRV
jgi:glycosyltransferase involved in cell wall biosynthesis